MQGRIIKLISNDYTVLAEGKEYVCKSRGKFRNLKITPLVGDLVAFDEKNYYIMEIKERDNELVRPPVANIDQAVIIMSLKEPDFSANLLDKLLTVIEFNRIKPIICFTKLDLLSFEEMEEMKSVIHYYQEIGYEVYKNTELSKIKTLFKHKISVFTGQSGAGKSTLLNNLDPNLRLQTGVISKALGRGKHTTRHVELIPLFEGLVADTPGFSSLIFMGMTDQDIRDQFLEFNQYRDECQYADCMHVKEDACMIKEKVQDGTILESRYRNYLKFINRED